MDCRILILIILTSIITGCGKYSRGDLFKANFKDDSLVYVVAANGIGEKISAQASKLKYEHESKGNSCVITYLTDSAELNNKKGLLLFNSALPNLEEDFLSKGFLGQFTSRQIVSYLLVSHEDIGKYLTKKE